MGVIEEFFGEILSLIPDLGFMGWIFVGLLILVTIIVMILAGYGIWKLIFSKQYRDPYKDKYQEMLATAKNNCPDSIYGSDFWSAGDVHHPGKIKGTIVGYNQMYIEDIDEYYDIIVYTPAGAFNLFNPLTWTVHDIVAIVAPKDRTPLAGAVKWLCIGTDRVGFYEFAITDRNLTPTVTQNKMAKQVDLTHSKNMLKELGFVTDEALTSNAALKIGEKIGKETLLSKP